MMDKIVVTAADIEKLLAWRDEHNDLVRSMPVPLREVEIQIVESGISIKCFRSDKKLKLYLDSPDRKLGHVVFAPLGNGLWKKKVSTLPADCNPTETEQGALTVYGSLMALMTYGTGSICQEMNRELLLEEAGKEGGDPDYFSELQKDELILGMMMERAKVALPPRTSTYDVVIVEYLKKVVPVEAASWEEAKMLVNEAWDNGTYVLTADDFAGVSFTLGR